ncbi:MAG: hypothetical protein HC786_18410 [Richelia sp. CSU_2_1]|nr:hypothetical protein [Microcoleus sp. SU_5_6]NJL69758.1 hypothetical protein [Microcoleus sp. SM1_3_4]NJR23986.1 hypothetical protein [Richelia sp. CSU_2_1]
MNGIFLPQRAQRAQRGDEKKEEGRRKRGSITNYQLPIPNSQFPTVN